MAFFSNGSILPPLNAMGINPFYPRFFKGHIGIKRDKGGAFQGQFSSLQGYLRGK